MTSQNAAQQTLAERERAAAAIVAAAAAAGETPIEAPAPAPDAEWWSKQLGRPLEAA